jgi:spore germination protein KB
MKTQGISQRQAGAVAALFLLGNCLIFGVNTASGRDTWIALLAAAALSIPVLCVYARLLSLYPGRGFFEIAETLLGRVLGAVFTVLLIWFALHSAAYLMRSVMEFIFVNVLPSPPFMLFTGAFALTGVYLLRRGSEAVGKWAVVGFALTVLCVGFGFVFSMREMDFRAFLPVLRRPAGDVLRGAGQIMAFPFLQSVLLLPFLARRNGIKPRRALLSGLLAASAVMLLIVVQQLALLGEHPMQSALFPSYAASKIIRAGSFLSRLEKMISGYLLVAGLTHLAVCLNAASRGLARLFRIGEPAGLIAPAALCATALSWFVAADLPDLKAFQGVFPYYAVLFELAIPLILWILAEIRCRARREAPEAKAEIS